MSTDRRAFLVQATTGGVLLATAALARAADEKSEEDVPATEDLMREHGVLNRILLIFEEGLRRLEAKDDVPGDVFLKPAKLVRQFVEDYHEELEEKHIFPEFKKAGKLTDLVDTLKRQHDAGRAVTDIILRSADNDSFRKPDAQRDVATAARQFIHMYRPHEAREDTVLFPPSASWSPPSGSRNWANNLRKVVSTIKRNTSPGKDFLGSSIAEPSTRTFVY